MSTTTLGAMMRAWRTGANVRVKDMAVRMRKGRTTIFFWESGQIRPDPVDIRRYGESLGVPEAAIMRALDVRSRSDDVESAEPAA